MFGILLWILFGALAGWLTSLIMGRSQQGFLMDIVLGIVGAVAGGFVMNLLGFDGVTGFNLYSLLVALFGAVIVVAVARAVK